MRLKKCLNFLLLVLIINDTICQPGQFSYFYLNIGPLLASVSNKTLSYKKMSVLIISDLDFKYAAM